jgi:hypothetical protein
MLILSTAAAGFILDIRERSTPLEPRNAAFVTSSGAATRIDIPDVRGMPASDARAQLERAGLKLAGAEAAVGTPGQVLWTRPAIGRRVPSDTPVTIVVGVDTGRFVLENSGLWPEGQDRADIIDFLTMWPAARRRVARLVGEIDATKEGLDWILAVFPDSTPLQVCRPGTHAMMNAAVTR